MRSRFTAHVADDQIYLHRTHQPTANQPFVADTDATQIKWTRLVIHAHEPGKKPDIAYVDFSAFFSDEAGEQAIHEKSEFHRADGRWLYARAIRFGPAPFKSATPKAGRNDPCLCGSGKKFKHCCLARA